MVFSLIKHTEKLLEEKEEKLCVKILRTLQEMMVIDPEYGEKVGTKTCFKMHDAFFIMRTHLLINTNC